MDYNKLTKKELVAKAYSLKKEINDYKFDLKSGDLANLNDYRKAKKDLAIVLTIVNEIDKGIRKEKKSVKTEAKKAEPKKVEAKVEKKKTEKKVVKKEVKTEKKEKKVKK
jgi:ribosomal protein L29